MDRPRDQLVSIILPVHNQGDHIAGIVAEYHEALSQGLRARHEFILVLNGCVDGSFEACQALAGTNGVVKVIASAQPGWGFAVKTGIAASAGDTICYTNSARTTPQDLATVLLYALIHPDVVVKATRKIRDGRVRRLGSLLFNLECRALFDLAYWDINGTPKAFPRAFDPLLRMTRSDDLIDLEFSIVCRTYGYQVIEVPVFSARRHGGRSTTTWRSAAKMYWGSYRLWRHLRAGERRA